MKLVKIEWWDAHHSGNGEWLDVVPEAGAYITTVGMLIGETDRYWQIAHTMQPEPDEMFQGVFNIPKVCVEAFIELTPKMDLPLYWQTYRYQTPDIVVDAA